LRDGRAQNPATIAGKEHRATLPRRSTMPRVDAEFTVGDNLDPFQAVQIDTRQKKIARTPFDLSEGNARRDSNNSAGPGAPAR
jgi:hypothetical protein